MKQCVSRGFAAVWVTVSLVAATAASAQAEGVGSSRISEPGPPTVIHRVNPRSGAPAPTVGSTTKATPISYHGGPVIFTPTVYLIWYGNWGQASGSDTAAGKQIVRDFATSIGGSPHFLINQSYNVSGSVSFTANTNEATDSYSRGSRLKESDILGIVTSAISAKKLPYNQFGVYFVLTSSDDEQVRRRHRARASRSSQEKPGPSAAMAGVASSAMVACAVEITICVIAMACCTA